MRARARQGCVLLVLAACALHSRSQPASWIREAEDCVGPCAPGVGPERRLTASAGVALGRELGSRSGQVLEYALEWPGGDAVLWLRASQCRSEVPVPLDVDAAGSRAVVAVANTLHWDRFEWFSCRLGPLSAGPLPVTLTTTADHQEILLDQLGIRAAGSAPGPATSPAVFRSRDYELRASTHGSVFDPPWVFGILRRQREYLSDLLGFDVQGPVVLVAVAPEDWPDPATSAFQSGCLVYLPMNELHLAWRNYPHELCHLFQERGTVPVPRFFTEGVAGVASLLSEADLFARTGTVGEREAELHELLVHGDASHPAGSLEVNPVFLWGSPGFGTASPRCAYDWSFAMVCDLVQRFGRELLAKAYRRLQDPTDPLACAIAGESEPLSRARALVALLSAAAGQDLAPDFVRWGLPGAAAP